MTIAALRGGPEFAGWGQDRYMLADVIDAIQNLTYIQMASKTKRKPPKPKPFPRPKRNVKQAVNNFTAAARAMYTRKRN